MRLPTLRFLAPIGAEWRLFLALSIGILPAFGADRPTLVIQGGTLFDGTGSILQNQVIVVSGDRIQEIGPSDRVRIPDGVERIDATGKFILPGLIDTHFHFNVRSDPVISPWLPLRFLANGATTLREMGNWIVEENQAWIQRTEAQGLPVPRLLSSGPVLDGAHTLLPTQSHVLLDDLDARRVVKRLIDQGATSIKVYSRLPLSLVKVVIDEAHGRGVPVHAHLGAVDPRDAIAVGLDGLEHGNMLCQAMLPPLEAEAFRQAALRDPDPRSFDVWLNIDPFGEAATRFIDLMLRHHVNLNATLALHEPSPDAPEQENRRKAFRNIAAFVVRYQRAGGSVAMGSHGKGRRSLPGFALLREIALHVEAGMTTTDALQGATRVAANALRLKDRGTLTPGKLADILILDADPLGDIKNLSRTHAVILGGRILDREKLLAQGR